MQSSSCVSYNRDEDSDDDIRIADYSALTKKPAKRGRPRTRNQPVLQQRAQTTPPVETQRRRFDENIAQPHYPGDPTQEEINENIANYVYVTTRSQNDYLRQWLPHRNLQLNALLEMEGPMNPNNVCEECSAADAPWRCRHCSGLQMLCRTCMFKRHRYNPFHRVEKWNGNYFRQGGLWEVGVQLYLGHKGKVCPRNAAAATSTERLPNMDGEPSAVVEPFVEELGDPDLPEEDQAGDVDDDELVFEEPEVLPGIGVKVPKVDAHENRFLSIVDITGIHYLPVVTCNCPAADPDQKHLEYIRMSLYPASFITVQTVFTEAVLRDYRLTNLECKTSAYQYYQKLRRLTSPAFPKTVINRYRELRRLSRQYRNLKLWKIHGKIYEGLVDTTTMPVDPPESDDAPTIPIPPPPPQTSNTIDTRGTLALFCAACPQPGINLPANWKEHRNQKLFTRSLVADGNFKADQLNLKNQQDDVALTNGEAFMTADAPYQAHLRDAEKMAHRYKTEPTCHNHHATADADKAVVGKRVRGVGAHACARHGCFCPSSVVDFTKGEKQMHMDWSLVQAIATCNMEELERLFHIYDVNCQFAIKLKARLHDSMHMTVPERLKIISGIGLFHVHGHVEECLYRYASTYIPGVGIIDGEVLETLWAVLNLTSPSTRGATIAHRTEVLDDHMGDSNWKKIINTYISIGKRYTRAKEQEPETRWYLEDIEVKIPEDLLQRWEREQAAAALKREDNPKAMDFMRSKVTKGKTRKEIEAELGARELRERATTGSAAWIAQGLELEFAQLELRSVVRKYGPNPTTSHKLDLLKKRRKLRNLVEKYIITTAEYLDARSLHFLNNIDTVVTDVDAAEDEIPDSEFLNLTCADPERQKLPFPSGITTQFMASLPAAARGTIEALRKVEVRMREGQANDCLEAVRNALIQLSWQYKNVVRQNKSQATRNRAWDGARMLIAHWKHQRQLYNDNRFAMLAAADDPTTIQRKYPFLHLTECVTSHAITDPNTPGQSSDKLGWIWRGNQIQENFENNNFAVEFWRINWLKANAIHERWKEELELTKHEMQWTVNYYAHMAEKWVHRRDAFPHLSVGHHAYALKKAQMWLDLGKVAKEHFESLRRRK